MSGSSFNMLVHCGMGRHSIAISFNSCFPTAPLSAWFMLTSSSLSDTRTTPRGTATTKKSSHIPSTYDALLLKSFKTRNGIYIITTKVPADMLLIQIQPPFTPSPSLYSTCRLADCPLPWCVPLLIANRNSTRMTAASLGRYARTADCWCSYRAAIVYGGGSSLGKYGPICFKSGQCWLFPVSDRAIPCSPSDKSGQCWLGYYSQFHTASVPESGPLAKSGQCLILTAVQKAPFPAPPDPSPKSSRYWCLFRKFIHNKNPHHAQKAVRFDFWYVSNWRHDLSYPT